MENIEFKELQNGEINGAAAFEIVSIPDISNFSDMSINETEEISKAGINSLLSETYQTYKMKKLSGEISDISLEILWLTEEVYNQPYKAKIRIFIVIRYIGDSKENVNAAVKDISELCTGSLSSMRYRLRQVQCSEIISIYQKNENTKIRAIVKEERLKNLQNQVFPVCYSYDVIPNENIDLSHITNSLISYPNCIVSLQLMTTFYSAEEMQIIEQTVQILDNLHNGIGMNAINGVKSTLTESVSESYRYYEKNKNSALFNFNMLVYGNEEAVTNVSTKIYGHINSNTSKNVALKFVELTKNEVQAANNFFPLPWAVNELLLEKGRRKEVWESGLVDKNSFKLPYIITAEEGVSFFRLPIGNENVGAGLPVNDVKKSSRTYNDSIIDAGDIFIGELKSATENNKIGISLNDLTKHLLITGTPGSGKTTFSIGLLDQLWKKHGIPFLVIEPAKNEYRALIKSIPQLQVFTPGKNFISPFVFNPFIPPKNVKLEAYKSTLKTAFSAAVSMTTPLDKIFEESISNCYSEFRWLDTYTKDDGGLLFNIEDFIKCFQKTFDNIGYTGDARNIGRAGTVRLNSLVKLFDNYYSIPIEDILTKPTVIELAAIENSDEKALIIALLLLSILAYVNANYVGEGKLKNLILLEEAHVLFDAGYTAMPGEANPSDIAQHLIKRMLAEARAYGVGLSIADQSPRKVTADVVALTDIKIAFRLVEAEDKNIVADSTNMDEGQKKRLAKLKPGEAFLFFNKLEEPEEIITEDYRTNNDIDITIKDETIKTLSKYWKTKLNMLKPYPQCAYVQYCDKGCDYNRRVLCKDIAKRIYTTHFTAASNDFHAVEKVFGQISSLIKNELNNGTFSRELLSCVKAHLWRKIKYNTNIKINEKLIENSLKKF